MKERPGRDSHHLAPRAAWLSAGVLVCLALGLWPSRAAASYRADRIIVKYRAGAGPQKRAATCTALGARSVQELAIIDAQVLQLDGITVEQAIERARRDPAVAYAEPDFELSVAVLPNDPRFPELYGLHNTGQFEGFPGADIKAPEAWDLFTGDPDLKIGVIDTGIDANHPDLAANVWTNPGEIPGNHLDDDNNGYVDDVHGYDFANHDGDPFDDYGHGVHVAGTIGAVGNNGIGITGVAWQCKIVGIKFLSGSGRGDVGGAIAGLQYAVKVGCRVTNNSYGGGEFSQAWLDAIEAAGRAGVLFVAAAGNEHDDTDAHPFYPAGFDTPYVISVAATNQYDDLAEFSNFGTTSVDLAAPGEAILSLHTGGGYIYLAGTSMAAPHVTGVAALVAGRFPDLDILQVKNRILTTVDPQPTLAGLCLSGGRLNAYRALVRNDTTAPAQVTDVATGDVGSTALELTWTATGDDGREGNVWTYDIRYDTQPITAATFSTRAQRLEAPRAALVGEKQHLTVRDLAYSTTYWFALRAIDDDNNTSAISNVTSATTRAAPHAAASPPDVQISLPTGLASARTVTLRNDGQGRLDFEIPQPRIAPNTAAGALIAGEGGPDAFGYRWIDSDLPDGPSYAWIDAPTVGNLVSGDEAMSAQVALPFAFPFYGQAFQRVRVCSNGYLSFTDPAVRFNNVHLPSADASANLIAPYWDDLVPRTMHLEATADRFVVTWENAQRFRTPGDNTFQVVLYPSGEIRFQYQRLGDAATGATVGVQNQDRTIGLTVVSNEPYLRPGLALRIVPLRQWLDISTHSGRIEAGQSRDIDLHFNAARIVPGVYHSALAIRTNDIDAPLLNVPVVLTVTPAPDLVAIPRPVDFGSVFVGATAARILRISNEGSAPLHVSGISGPPFLSYATQTLGLDPGASQDVLVTYAPGAVGALAGDIIVASDDPDAAESHVRLAGRAIPAPSFSLDANSFAIDLTSNAVATRTLRVTNGGGSPFVFTAGAVLDAGTAAGTVPEPGADKAGLAPQPPAVKGAADRDHGPVPARSGGPDRFGYRYTDSDEPDGAAFDWINIAAAGTRVPFGNDDENLGPFPTGFPFPFYGASFNAFRICTNGFVSLTSSSATFANAALPARSPSSPENLLAVFWDDFDFSLGGSAFYLYDGTKLVVQFQDVVRYGETALNRFEIVLYPDGRIVYQYAAVGAAYRTSATVGIQNAVRDVGLQVAFNTDYVHDGLAVRFTPPARFLTLAPAGGTIAPGGFLDLRLRFDAANLLAGTYHAALRLAGNDPRLPVFHVPAQLSVTGAPDLVATPDTLDFGVVDLGFPQVRQLVIRNPGAEPLFVRQIETAEAAFAPRTNTLAVPPFGRALVDVRFAPAAAREYQEILFVRSNDPDQPNASIALRGTGRVPPDVVVDGASLLTARIPPGASVARTLTVRNAGASPLEFALTVRARGVPVGGSATAARAVRGAGGGPAPASGGLELGKQATDPRPGIQGGGGPDGYGNRWRDSTSPGGPVFDWVDVTTDGTRLNLTRDDQTQAGIAIGFDFPFYGATMRSVSICTNGWLSFASTDSSYSNQPLPSNGPRVPRALVAPLWDDYSFASGGSAYVRSEPGRFIVAWISAFHFITGQPATFEAILYPDGRIVFQYLHVPASGSSPTIGMQDDTGGDGLLVAYNTNFARAGFAVEIRPGDDWLRPSTRSGVLLPGAETDVIVQLDARELALGRYAGVVSMETNDPDEGAVQLPVTIVVAGPTDVDASLPHEWRLRVAGGNPASGSARLELALPSAASPDIALYDVRGALVRRLAAGAQSAGWHEIAWDGRDAAGHPVAAGLYFARATVHGRTLRARIVLVR